MYRCTRTGQFFGKQLAIPDTLQHFIARFPVTVAQWREYTRLSDRSLDDERNLSGRDNDPVLYVSWHDAMGFCHFLTEAWRRLLPQGFVVTLPSEAEWEKAARGGERVPAESPSVTPQQFAENWEAMSSWVEAPNPSPARAYSWGEELDAEKANVESIIGETSAVGCYPAGLSPYGCEDMSGNVREWTRSLWGTSFMKPDFVYPYQPDDPKRENLDAGNETYRVVRGGSWDYPRGGARCASRLRLAPEFRLGTLGFRVVVRFAPFS